LWSKKGITAEATKLDSEEAGKALMDYQETEGKEGLVLVMKLAESNEHRVTFFLLSKQIEQELQNELTLWDKLEDPILKAIGRAYEYSRRGLFVESAEEYETALKSAPDSLDLIRSAIEANRQIGNYVRVEQLNKKLSGNKK
jgi:hypothetical protein